ADAGAMAWPPPTPADAVGASPVSVTPASAASASAAPVGAAPVGAGGSLSTVAVQRPETLKSYGAVGGMVELKRELKETVGLVMAFPEKADAYRIDWNGILL